MKISYYVIPVFLVVILVYALVKKHNAYKSFTEGIKEGVDISLGIMPTMITMYISIGILDASGLLDLFISGFKFPPELIGQGLFKPFSYQASSGFMIDIFNKYGVDSNEGKISSIIQATADSSIYIMSLYFGAFSIVKTRKAYVIGICINLFSYILCIIIYIIISK